MLEVFLMHCCRPLSEAPVASLPQEAAPADLPIAEEVHVAEFSSATDNHPGQVEESQPHVQASDAPSAASQVNYPSELAQVGRAPLLSSCPICGVNVPAGKSDNLYTSHLT